MISNHEQKSEVLTRFPAIAGSGPDFQSEFFETVSIASIPANQVVCMEGDQCSHLALLLTGSVRVYKVAESGREITLYRIQPGESCILTASCIISDIQFPALAVTETEASAVLVPAKKVSEWMSQSTQWRDFVFSLVAKRMADVITLIDQVVFQRMDMRIAAYLLKRPLDSGDIRITHHEIAAELGTAREVISRTLKNLEEAGLINVEKARIHIADRQGLEYRASYHNV
ncbi:MAG: Crp/Fnr family transcriptional regulator [Gammaproteobacteria bacterium]